jgi:hypothetical protein
VLYNVSSEQYESKTYDVTEERTEHQVFSFEFDVDTKIDIRLDEKPNALNHSKLILVYLNSHKEIWGKSYQLTNENFECVIEAPGTYQLILITEPLQNYKGGTYPQVEVNWLIRNP